MPRLLKDEFSLHPEGAFGAKLDRIEEVENSFGDKFKTRLRFVFLTDARIRYIERVNDKNVEAEYKEKAEVPF